MDMKQVWRLILSYPRNWKVSFKDQTWKEVDLFVEALLKLIKAPLALMSS
jgi:hypothetical protein